MLIKFSNVVNRFNEQVAGESFEKLTLNTIIRGSESAIDSANLIIILMMLEEELCRTADLKIDLFEILDSDESIITLREVLKSIERGMTRDS
jgi:hypothetical protein